jgi:uncharacterized ferredoxin-like protein
MMTPNMAVKAGARYCKIMALAAVVVLLAATKSSIVAALARAAPTRRGHDHAKRKVRTIIRRKKKAIRLLMPAIRNGFQSRIFMKRPATLQRKAQAIMENAPSKGMGKYGLIGGQEQP